MYLVMLHRICVHKIMYIEFYVFCSLQSNVTSEACSSSGSLVCGLCNCDDDR